jgi:hypothetical protein
LLACVAACQPLGGPRPLRQLQEEETTDRANGYLEIICPYKQAMAICGVMELEKLKEDGLVPESRGRPDTKIELKITLKLSPRENMASAASPLRHILRV